MSKLKRGQSLELVDVFYPGKTFVCDKTIVKEDKSISLSSDGKNYACGGLALTDIFTVYLLTNLVVRLHRYLPCGFVSFVLLRTKISRSTIRVHDSLRAKVSVISNVVNVVVVSSVIQLKILLKHRLCRTLF